MFALAEIPPKRLGIDPNIVRRSWREKSLEIGASAQINDCVEERAFQVQTIIAAEHRDIVNLVMMAVDEFDQMARC